MRRAGALRLILALHPALHLALILAPCLPLIGCQARAPEMPRSRCQSPAALAGEARQRSGMRWIPAGRYIIGDRPQRREEGPPHPATLKGFWIDQTEITNAQFARFVSATQYVTLAERAPDPALYPGVPLAQLVPSSLVFTGLKPGEQPAGPASWWKIVPGADWRHPQGPGSSIDGRGREPVVHIGYDDALAYARWRGHDLPTEAEWEAAAQGGLRAKLYSWGDAPPGGDGKAPARANIWQGSFPVIDAGGDGYKARIAPVACFPANGFGLYDMAGNVWEWTTSFMQDADRDPSDPPLPNGGRHVIKGGSFLCADNYCYRYRPAARSAGPPDGGASHIGFRTVWRPGASPAITP